MIAPKFEAQHSMLTGQSYPAPSADNVFLDWRQ
jgi:hypothetical protein